MDTVLICVQSNAVLQAFKAERAYLFVSTKAKKPEIQPPELMTELHTASDTINNIRESNRASPLIDHLSAVAEGILALGWFFDSKPADLVKEMLAGIEYYGNKVLKEYREKYVLALKAGLHRRMLTQFQGSYALRLHPGLLPNLQIPFLLPPQPLSKGLNLER